MIRIFIIAILLILSRWIVAAEAPSQPTQTTITDEMVVNWVFTGGVTDENGDLYNYYFQMRRRGKQFHSLAALFDAQTKKLLVHASNDAVIENPEADNWRVGNAFLHFNPINETWIFGLKTENKTGFNFKVDMLKQPDNHIVAQDLRPGLAFIVSQTGRLNGHILNSEPGKDQFVTASNAWFRQIWITQAQDKEYRVSGILCRFNDSSGFYSMQLNDTKALRGAIAGSFDANGVSREISQFVRASQDPDQAWSIHLAAPNRTMVLSDVMKQEQVVAGFVMEKEVPGFCMLSDDDIG